MIERHCVLSVVFVIIGLTVTARAAPVPADIPRDFAKLNRCSEFKLSEDDLNPLNVGTLPFHWQVVNIPGVPSVEPDGVYGGVRYSHVASNDLFLDHDAHDVNFYVALDQGTQQFSLNSDGNYKNQNTFLPNSNGERLLEVEWDMQHFPSRFWPTIGDRIWMLGRHVWDCGHTTSFHTEIHPPKAIAATRLQPLRIEGDATYSLTNVTYIYIHGRGGYFDAPVATRDYELNIETPPRPAGFVGPPGSWLLETPYGGPAPEIIGAPAPGCAGTAASPCTFRVRYPLALGDDSPDRRFAAVIASGWRTPATVRFRTFQVHFDKVTVLNRHNLLCLADWKMWLNINGQWINVEGMAAVNNGTEVEIGRDVTVAVVDSPDSALTIQATGWVSEADQAFGVTKSPGRAATVFEKISQIATRFDGYTGGKIGLFFERFGRTDNFGVGNHPQSTSKAFQEIDSSQLDNQHQAENAAGDFRIQYSIQELP